MHEQLESFRLLIHQDIQNIFERIINRKSDYLLEFSLKRSRDHFKDIFYTRFYDIKISELAILSTKELNTYNQFYKDVDDLKWYLFHTQDMGTTVEDRVNYFIKLLEKSYQTIFPIEEDSFENGLEEVFSEVQIDLSEEELRDPFQDL